MGTARQWRVTTTPTHTSAEDVWLEDSTDRVFIGSVFPGNYNGDQWMANPAAGVDASYGWAKTKEQAIRLLVVKWNGSNARHRY